MTALGGADAIQKVTSRVMKGTIQTGGSETPIELFTKAPNKRDLDQQRPELHGL